ncbi:S66 family peptidase [Heyndrickxia ginsengihumi]|uniref:LD-carboxypeptidase n=1 Tax=Heyndrickxia ginsengihumi TaxID=363870 RepID=A0A6M0PCW9_9BACI|nr:S66 peptidase family protein [Heyndrickxia ginsengihumi]MBE6185248.1 LD-carboxypeptidase [Bacillus sp. (in: firmicutes)]MCM3023431.1 LD-carboxypeptidase [Heyndrickxia ginsengihumi]NEY21578.1 LD-carboxypeptidase [Heyndrickxia ginsengihumi]
MLPERLQIGDEIRVIAPSRSMALLKSKQVDAALSRLHDLGFHVTFGKHVDVHDEFFSTSIEQRIEDLHQAFLDDRVKAVLTAIGGYNANQLLNYIDYDLIKDHPKILCGYSDITALQLALYKQTGLITYSGPFFSTFGMKKEIDYTIQSFLQAVTNDAMYEIEPSDYWSDDKWYEDQENRTFYPQQHYEVINEGTATGTLIGGNLSTLNLLQGTAFFPSLNNAILFIEDDEENHPFLFDRHLQALLHLPDAVHIQALLIGRFQKGSHMTMEALQKIIHDKRELKDIPIIANVNFGHTDPIATIPIGAKASVKAFHQQTEIIISQS